MNPDIGMIGLDVDVIFWSQVELANAQVLKLCFQALQAVEPCVDSIRAHDVYYISRRIGAISWDTQHILGEYFNVADPVSLSWSGLLRFTAATPVLLFTKLPEAFRALFLGQRIEENVWIVFPIEFRVRWEDSQDCQYK